MFNFLSNFSDFFFDSISYFANSYYGLLVGGLFVVGVLFSYFYRMSRSIY